MQSSEYSIRSTGQDITFLNTSCYETSTLTEQCWDLSSFWQQIQSQEFIPSSMHSVTSLMSWRSELKTIRMNLCANHRLSEIWRPWRTLFQPCSSYGLWFSTMTSTDATTDSYLMTVLSNLFHPTKLLNASAFTISPRLLCTVVSD